VCRRIRRSPAQKCKILCTRLWVRGLQPFFVGDGLFLHVLHVDRPAARIVAIKLVGAFFAAQDLDEQVRQFDGVVNSAVETKPADRVVDVRSVAGEESAAWLKRAATRWWTL
jgi:hypothetical protein